MTGRRPGIYESCSSRAHKIMSMLEETNVSKHATHMYIYIAPPVEGALTDEDSGDEDEGGTINNLTARQLESEAELVLHRLDAEELRIGEDNIHLFQDGEFIDEMVKDPIVDATPESREESEGNKISVPTKKASKKCKHVTKKAKKSIKKMKTNIRKWVDEDMPGQNELLLSLEEEKCTKIFKPLYLSQPMTPLDFFNLFFDEEMFTLIVKETVRYAMEKGTQLELGVDEMKLFIGVLLLSGYENKMRRSFYWEEADDVMNVLVSKNIRKNRFNTIMQFIHFNNNNKINIEDRLYKLRPVIDKLKNACLQFNIWDCESSIDEAMIPYYGRHSMKQHIQQKPIRFGYKAWCWNNRLGYLIDFDIYQGAKGKVNEFMDEFGLGGGVVLQFCNKIPRLNSGELTPTSLFADNFFTSLRLVDKLSKMRIGYTGTIRSNRIEKCPLRLDMNKTTRGTFDYKYDEINSLLVCRWNDNSTVTVVSNHLGVNPMAHARRYSYSERKKISVPQPNMIKRYNENMGGTDRMDQNIAYYRTGIRSRKWYWPLFAWLLDVSVQNAWLLYRKMREDLPDEPKFDLLGFRRYLARNLLTSYGIPRKRPGPTSASSSRRMYNIRYDNIGHNIVNQQKRTRCVSCKSTTIKKCNKCNVALHEKCFNKYHIE